LSGRRFASSCACSIADFSDASSNCRRRLLAVVHGDGRFLIVLDEVGGDRRIRVTRGRPFSAGKADFDAVGLGHVQDPVGDRFDVFARETHKRPRDIADFRVQA